MSKKLNMIDADTELKSERNGVTAYAGYEIDYDDECYYVTYYVDGNPSHNAKSCNTLEELEVLMRGFQKDLRKWSIIGGR